MIVDQCASICHTCTFFRATTLSFAVQTALHTSENWPFPIFLSILKLAKQPYKGSLTTGISLSIISSAISAATLSWLRSKVKARKRVQHALVVRLTDAVIYTSKVWNTQGREWLSIYLNRWEKSLLSEAYCMSVSSNTMYTTMICKRN